MASIDYRKAYDMVPHSWIIECLENMGVNDEIIRFFKESMHEILEWSYLW